MEPEVETPTEPEQVDEDVSGAPPEEPEADAETPSDAAPAADEDADPEPWRNLAEKYGTTDLKVLKRIVGEKVWEQTKALSAASKRIKELEGRLEAPPAAKPAPEEDTLPDPDIQKLDQELQRLDNREKTLSEKTASQILDLSGMRDEIQQIKGQLKIATESEKEALESRLEIKEIKYASAFNSWELNRDALSEVRVSKARMKEERGWMERLHKEGKARQQAEQQASESNVAQLPKQIDALTLSTMNDAGFPADPDLRKEVTETVAEYMTAHFGRVDPKTPIAEIDVPGLIKKRVDRFMKANKISARQSFADESRRRTAVSGKAAETQNPAKPAKPGASGGGLSRFQLAKRAMIAWGAGGKR